MSKQHSDDFDEPLSSRRGKLKVFIGAVPGVGKTYKMLAEAQRRCSRGEDIVVGLVETHGRPQTAKMAEGLEQIPLKHIGYRGKFFEELDTEAIIARKPEWVLVDELAHTNVPGTVHAKRWQSVEEILEAGINVISTVNVQHMESMNDVVYDITGVRVRETLPDSVVDSADEVELVDLTPAAVINRLKRGDIYKAEKVPQALSNFFRKGNIVALRELALRKTADEVEYQLQEYIEANEAAKAAAGTVLVCVAPTARVTKLIRRGYRMASRLQASLVCLHISVPGITLSSKEETLMQEAADLCRNLGGKMVVLEGESPHTEIADYIKSTNVSFVVMGQSTRSRFQEVVRGSIINRIMRETQNVDVMIVGDADTGANE